MTTPKSLAEIVARTAGGAEVQETSSDLIFHAVLDDPALLATWRALRASPPVYVVGIFIVLDGSDEELSDQIDPAARERFRFTIQKTAESRELRIFFAQSMTVCANALENCTYVQIADMTSQETFATFAARFQPWTIDPVAPFAPSEQLTDPRNLCKDFTGANTVPPDVRPWLTRTKPPQVGQSYDAWERAALRRLMAALSDQVTLETGTIKYHFSGPPTRHIILSDAELGKFASAIAAGADWVFGAGLDTETRHLLFANEWARGYQNASDPDFGERTLESAKAAYKAYVNSSSRETLKALAELRKAVIEETQKVSQRAQDLASSLWKDLAVAAAPFVLKVLTDAASVPASLVAATLAFAAAVFLVFSFGVQVFINARFFQRQGDSRAIWRQALNTVLSPDNLNEFSEQPIQNSLSDYKKVRAAVGVFYAVLIVGLIGFGIFEISNPKSPTKTAATNTPVATALIHAAPTFSARSNDTAPTVPLNAAATSSGLKHP